MYKKTGTKWLNLEDTRVSATAESVVIGKLPDRTEGSNSGVLIIEETLDDTLNILSSDLLNTLVNLDRVDAALVGEHLTTKILANSSRTLELVEERKLELVLSLIKNDGVDIESISSEGVTDVAGEDIEVESISNSIDTEETSVGVDSVEGSDGLGDVVSSDGGHHRRRGVNGSSVGSVVRTNHHLEDHEGVVVGISPASSLEGISEVSGGHVIITDADLRADEVSGLLNSLNAVGSLGGDSREDLLSLSSESGVVDVTSSSDNHAGSNIVSLDVAVDVLLGDGLDVLLRTEDGARERRATVSGLVETVKDDLLHAGVNILHLTKNDRALSVHGILRDLGVEEDITEDIESLVDILLENLGIENSLLTRGVSVKLTTNVLDLLLELNTSALTSALEKSVLKEVSDTVVLSVLITRTSINEDTNSSHLTGASLSSDTETVLKSRDLSNRVVLRDEVTVNVSIDLGELRRSGSDGTKSTVLWRLIREKSDETTLHGCECMISGISGNIPLPMVNALTNILIGACWPLTMRWNIGGD